MTGLSGLSSSPVWHCLCGKVGWRLLEPKERCFWRFRAVAKNATNASDFRANFTELFCSTIALAERPRSWQASVICKF